MTERRGRGRLSAIDQLPDDAEAAIVWANAELRAHKLPQVTIFEGFNARLAAHSIAPVSKSSFNRHAIRKAAAFRKIDDLHRITSELVTSLGTDGPDRATIAIAECIKLAAYDILDEGQQSPQDLAQLARAVSSAVGAQKTSAAHRRLLESDYQKKIGAAFANAESKLSASGLPVKNSSEILRKIREEVYGIFDEKARS